MSCDSYEILDESRKNISVVEETAEELPHASNNINFGLKYALE